jgi:hypothetical protein
VSYESRYFAPKALLSISREGLKVEAFISYHNSLNHRCRCPPARSSRLLKSDRDALRELAVAVASEPELRLAVINAVLADVATKQDIKPAKAGVEGGNRRARYGRS